MRCLVPLAQHIKAQRDDVDQRERRQKAGQSESERADTDAKQRRPQREQRQILRAVSANLSHCVRPVTPLLRRDGQPFQAAAARHQPGGDHDQTEADPDRPPIVLPDEFSPKRLALGGPDLDLYGLCHGNSGFGHAPGCGGGAAEPT